MKKIDIVKEIGCFLVSNYPKFLVSEKDKFECILIMEFNWGGNPLGLDENYLDKRFKLFDQYTFPSINAQTDTDFTWYLLMNDKTPQKYKDMMQDYCSKANMKMVLVYTDLNSNEYKVKDVMKSYVDEIKTDWLLSCRCDNDDILSKFYIEKMKEQFRPVNNMYIDFIRGYNLNAITQELNAFKNRSCHFLGYVENLHKQKETVLNYDHSLVKQNGWVRRLDNKKYPLWCEVVHDTNMINSFRGKPATNEQKQYFDENFVF